MDTPKTSHLQIENAGPEHDGKHHSAMEETKFEHIVGVEADKNELPEGYFRSKYFLGSFAAVGMGLLCAVATFGFVAPILTQINADLGPDPRYIWISLVYNTVLAVFLAPVGRLSDIFGRRYFFIGGGILGVVGTIVCATAKSVPTLIGGNVLLGISSATQLSFHFVIGELVPMKQRYTFGALLYLCTYPGSGFGPIIAFCFINEHPSVGWRGVYWLLLAGQVVALLLWICFYFPPSFGKKHRADINSKAYWIKHFDYVGTLLFAAGFIVFLMGLSWGGAVYPWKSAPVIVAVVGGLLTIGAFVLWEIYAPLKEPLLPMHLMKSGRWVSSCVLLGIGAGVYYAFAIIWPIQAGAMYGSTDYKWIGFVSSLVGIAIITGQVVGGPLIAPIGKTKFQCMAMFLLGGTCLGCLAVSTPSNMSVACVLLFFGCFFIGWNENICLANSTILVLDQREIGIAGGMAGTIRAFISAISVAIYVVVLNNRLTTTISTDIPAALLNAGLPMASVGNVTGAIATGTTTTLEGIPGLTDEILAAGFLGLRWAYAHAFKTVYLTTIAFSAIGFFLTFFAPNTEDFMSDQVAATLANEDNAFGGGEIVEKRAEANTVQAHQSAV